MQMKRAQRLQVFPRVAIKECATNCGRSWDDSSLAPIRADGLACERLLDRFTAPIRSDLSLERDLPVRSELRYDDSPDAGAPNVTLRAPRRRLSNCTAAVTALHAACRHKQSPTGLRDRDRRLFKISMGRLRRVVALQHTREGDLRLCEEMEG